MKNSTNELKSVKSEYTSPITGESYSQSKLSNGASDVMYITDPSYGVDIKKAVIKANIAWRYNIKSLFGTIARTSAIADKFACSVKTAKALETAIEREQNNIADGESFFDTL